MATAPARPNKAADAEAAEIAKQEEAHQKAKALLPKLYDTHTSDEAIEEIAALGSRAVGTLEAELEGRSCAGVDGYERPKASADT